MRCGDAEHLLQGDQRCEDDCNDHQEDENAVDASTTGHLPFAFATRWIDSPNRADLLMMVVIGRSNFSATVCSGVFALDRAISSRSCCIDHMRRLVLLAMIFPARIQQRQRREGKPESSGPRKLRGWNLRKAHPQRSSSEGNPTRMASGDGRDDGEAVPATHPRGGRDPDHIAHELSRVSSQPPSRKWPLTNEEGSK
jgi:hypothetical protein